MITSLPSSAALFEVAAELARARHPGQIVIETSTLPIATHRPLCSMRLSVTVSSGFGSCRRLSGRLCTHASKSFSQASATAPMRVKPCVLT